MGFDFSFRLEPAKAGKEYKEELSAAQEQNEMLTKIVGKMTVEKEWLEKKLKSLGLSDKKQLNGDIFKNLIDMGFDFSFRLVFFVLVVITASIQTE
jgi:hypothetical protein